MAPKVKPHVVDLFAHSIAWPDTLLPRLTAEGAKPVGHQESTGVFRSKTVHALMSEEKFDEGNDSYMRALRARNPPREDRQKLIFQPSEAEIEAGILVGWFSEEQMDEKYGRGRWRALPRHVIKQGQKWRLIDDGKAGESRKQ